MNKINIVWLFLLLVGCSNSDDGFSLLVKCQDCNNKTITIYDETDTGLVEIYSRRFEMGRVEIQTNDSSQKLVYLFVDGAPDYLPLFVDKSDIEVDFNYYKPDRSVVSGSDCHKCFTDFIQSYSAYCDKGAWIQRVRDEAKKNFDTSMVASLDSTYHSLEREKTNFQVRYIQANNTSPVSVYILATNLMYRLDEFMIAKLLANIPNNLRKGLYYNKVLNYLNSIDKSN